MTNTLVTSRKTIKEPLSSVSVKERLPHMLFVKLKIKVLYSLKQELQLMKA